MDISTKLMALEKLGRFMGQYEGEKEHEDLKGINAYFFEGFQQAIKQAELHNPWFSQENIYHALQTWSDCLTAERLQEWTEKYPADYWGDKDKKIAIIMAGNIPLVGFHDFITVLLSGYKVLAKPSTDDDQLLPFLAQILVAIEKGFAHKIEFADGSINNFDAVIATGSDNSARYFEHYFGKYPHVIRKNRTSVAVLSGDESEEELALLGNDIFQYFGLGCRNVSKLFIPKDFELDRVFKAVYGFKHLADHQKFGNNLDYYRAIYLMERIEFFENGFLILKEDEGLHAPTGVVFYERYDSLDEVKTKVDSLSDELQCAVTKADGFNQSIDLGNSQKPELYEYADNVDTVEFLAQL